ncbi:MAG: hypothetical protein ACRC33_00970 [Gemmataceae bacterium]
MPGDDELPDERDDESSIEELELDELELDRDELEEDDEDEPEEEETGGAGIAGSFQDRGHGPARRCPT